MTYDDAAYPRPDQDDAELISGLLGAESVRGLFELTSERPYIVARYYFDEPVELMSEARADAPCVFQFSTGGALDGDDPAEESWADLAPNMTAKARYWRLDRKSVV